MTRRGLLLAAAAAGLAACSGQRDPSAAAPSPTRAASPPPPSPSPSLAAPTAAAGPPAGDPATVATRATVPVLCWHQLRDWRPADAAYARRLLICPPATFRAQLDALAGAGFTTIGPDAYLDHLLTGAALPTKPVLLSFDDAQGTQATEALPQLQARQLTATFFVMTVVLGKKDWLRADDVRRFDAAGMTIAAHTWDHHRVDRYAGKDWAVQLEQPRAELEKIVGKPVEHFAYPYGAWNAAALPHVRAAGYRTAFQLQDKQLDASAPVETLRRILVDSTWTGPQLLRAVEAPI